MVDMFADIITYEDNYPRKPNLISFETLLLRNSIEKDETLVIVDRELDILGGKKAELKTYFFNSNQMDTENINCDFIRESLKAVLDLIK